MAATTRAALRYPALTDTPDVVRDVQNLANDADGVLVMYGEGTLAARPAAGKHGRFYYATDNQHLYYDYGSGWLDVTPITTIANGSVTLAMLAANSVDSSKIVDGSVTGADILDGTITATELAAALIPSQGAVSGAEALRALGTAAGTAARGDLSVSVWAESNGSSGLSGQAAAGTWYPYADTTLGCRITIPATGTYEVTIGHTNSLGINTNRQRSDAFGAALNGAANPTAQLQHDSPRLSGANALHARLALNAGDTLDLRGFTYTDLLEGGMVTSHRWLKAQRVA